MSDKAKRKNDHKARPSLIRIIIPVLLFFAVFVWIFPAAILCLATISHIIQIYDPFILLVLASIIGLFVAIPVCIGNLYRRAMSFPKPSKRKRGE